MLDEDASILTRYGSHERKQKEEKKLFTHYSYS